MQELNLFKIEGSVGGNQDWFRDFWMKKGGCGAVTALRLLHLFCERIRL